MSVSPCTVAPRRHARDTLAPLLVCVLAFAALFGSSAVRAQCASFGFSYPSDLVFDPVHPAAGEPVALVMRPATRERYSAYLIQRDGDRLLVRAGLNYPFLQTPEYPRIELGSLPTGVYEVTLAILGDEQIGPCPPMTTTLVVGSATLPVPGLGPAGSMVLMALLLLIGRGARAAATRAARR